MAKKKKKIATEAAKSSIRLQPVDAKENALKSFILKWKGKRLWLKFSGHCFIRVKVLESIEDVRSNYENVLVKILEKPNWITETSGTFYDRNRNGKEWKTAVVGTKLYTNFLSLYTTEDTLKYLDLLMNEKQSNLIAIRGQLKFAKKSVYEIETIQENVKKRLK